MDVRFSMSTCIDRPLEEVFAALVEPERLCRYFLRAASERLATGARVTWEWGGGETLTFDVVEVLENERVHLNWPAEAVPYNTDAVLSVAAIDANRTKITIEESGWQEDQAGLDSAMQHCAGVAAHADVPPWPDASRHRSAQRG
jgi:uncharacterized protein YndB with AHSA1/START domain